MTWLLNSDRDIWLQGWIPQRVIDKALSGAQFDYIRHMRARAEELTRARAGILDASIGSCEDIVINSEGWARGRISLEWWLWSESVKNQCEVLKLWWQEIYYVFCVCFIVLQSKGKGEKYISARNNGSEVLT